MTHLRQPNGTIGSSQMIAPLSRPQLLTLSKDDANLYIALCFWRCEHFTSKYNDKLNSCYASEFTHERPRGSWPALAFWRGLKNLRIKMGGWVLVNFRTEKKVEIFEVNDKEQARKKRKFAATILKVVYFTAKFLV